MKEKSKTKKSKASKERNITKINLILNRISLKRKKKSIKNQLIM
jgi:hypothetical protein